MPSEGWCRHGCMLPPDHVGNQFVEACYEEWGKAAVDGTMAEKLVRDAMIPAHAIIISTNPQDEVKSHFLEDGVNLILREN